MSKDEMLSTLFQSGWTFTQIADDPTRALIAKGTFSWVIEIGTFTALDLFEMLIARGNIAHSPKK